MRYFAKRILEKEIRYHENKRKIILYERDQNPIPGAQEEMWCSAAWELRYAERLRNLLKRYQ